MSAIYRSQQPNVQSLQQLICYYSIVITVCVGKTAKQDTVLVLSVRVSVGVCLSVRAETQFVVVID